MVIENFNLLQLQGYLAMLPNRLTDGTELRYLICLVLYSFSKYLLFLYV